MKELYVCIFEKFNLSLQEVNFFDYNKQDEVLTNKMQKAFLYYKTQSRDNKMMFMQFCRNLQKLGEEYSTDLNKKKFAVESRPRQRSYVFINIYNLNIMLVQNMQEKLFSFICIQSNTDTVALNEYVSIMSSNYNVDIVKERCTFFTTCQIMTGPRELNECGIVFYPLTLGEFKMLETSREDTSFKNVNDPMLVLSTNFICVSPFVSSINNYIKEATNIMTRKKSESAPVKPIDLPIEDFSEDEKDLLNQRFRDFDRSLDNVLKKYNLLN